jgi:hypothetical protein
LDVRLGLENLSNDSRQNESGPPSVPGRSEGGKTFGWGNGIVSAVLVAEEIKERSGRIIGR